MMRRTTVSVVALLLAFSSSFAQDRIFKSNGDIIEARIKRVDVSTILFVRFDNQNGPEYTITKNEVDKIKYQNGSEERFFHNANNFQDNSRQGTQPEPPGMPQHRDERFRDRFMPDLVAVAPIQFTENGIAGLGISYEHTIDRYGIITYIVPAILEFNTGSAHNNYNSDPMFYFDPGIKIYPTGNYGFIKYAIGPNLVIADGQKTM